VQLVANIVLVLLALTMGIRLLVRYVMRPRPHSLWYGVGLILIAAAALPEVYRGLTGNLPTAMWWLYWITASATVGFLGVGTAFLLSPKIGKVTLYTVALLCAAVLVATVLTAGSAPAEITPETFAHAPTAAIKIPFLIQNIGGSLMILVGTVISFIQTRGWYNVLIALGTMIFAAGGASAGLLKYSSLFYFTQTAGIIVLYAGVAMSIRPRPAQTNA